VSVGKALSEPMTQPRIRTRRELLVPALACGLWTGGLWAGGLWTGGCSQHSTPVPINVGDSNYDPLFPYGFGLTYAP